MLVNLHTVSHLKSETFSLLRYAVAFWTIVKEFLKRATRSGLLEGGFQITKNCLVIDKYRSEVAIKIDTVKDRGVRGGF